MKGAFVRVAVQSALVAWVCLAVGKSFTGMVHADSAGIGALWATITGIVVLQATPRETSKQAALRLVGTLIGAVIGAAYLYVFPVNALGAALAVGVTVLLCQFANVPDNGRLAAITVIIVFAVSVAAPGSSPILNGALRFGESCIGAAAAVLTVLLWRWPSSPMTGDPK
ncbi:MAG: FUSC family protein [Casimicrobiaceae bacterium]